METPDFEGKLNSSVSNLGPDTCHRRLKWEQSTGLRIQNCGADVLDWSANLKCHFLVWLQVVTVRIEL